MFGKIDVSEAQWSIIIAHLITAIYGQRVWSTVLVTLFGAKITLANVMIVATLFSLSRSILDNIHMAVGRKQTPLEHLGVNIPRRR